MKSIFLATLVSLLAGSASLAQAQVREGDVRLLLDMGLLTWHRQHTEAHRLLDRDESITGFGTGSDVVAGGGLGAGYVLTPHTILGMYTSLSRLRSTYDNGEDPTVKVTLVQLELRPNVELPLLTDRRIVPFAQLGLSYRYQHSKEDAEDTSFSDHGVGPTVGLGAHAFAAEAASFDVSLTFRPLFVFGDSVDSLEDAGASNAKLREYSLLLNIGASFWM